METECCQLLVHIMVTENVISLGVHVRITKTVISLGWDQKALLASFNISCNNICGNLNRVRIYRGKTI